jgi:IS5 family transposase
MTIRRPPSARQRRVTALRKTGTNSGGDMGQVEGTLEEIERRTGKRPEDYLIDGGYAKRETVDSLTEQGIVVFAPTMKPGKQRDPAKRQRKDSEAVAAWRQRMETDEAKEIYKQRAATVDTVNGDCKDHRGFDRLRVRGIERAQSVLLLTTLTYNLMRTFAIAPGLMT